ncbi:MAG: PEP-utilizing enzyme [Actinomycetota bacterium]
MPTARTWLPDWSHYPEQLTPLSATVWFEAVGLGIHAAMRTLRGPFGGFDARTDGGWAYEGEWAVEWEPVAGTLVEAGLALPERWEREYRPRAHEITAQIRLMRPESPDPKGALAELDRMWGLAREHWTIHFLAVIPAQAAMDAAAERYAAETGDQDELGAYALFDGPNESTAADAMLADLAEQARDLRVDDVLAAYRPPLALERLAELENGRTWLHGLREYLAAYGGRARLHEMSLPREAERPWMTLEAIRLLIQAGGLTSAGSLRGGASAPGRGPADAAEVSPELAEVLPAARFCYALKESHVYHIDYPGLLATREALLGFGRRLLAEGVLEAIDDLWMLRREEVRAAVAGEIGRQEVVELVTAAREELRRGLAEGPRPFLGDPPAEGDREGFLEKFYGRGDGAPGGRLLQGTPASRGIADGPARIVRDAGDLARVRPGDVLVAATTTPAWTPLFGALAGLVTETGGVLSHAAIVAREYRLPAVVGAADATTVLVDGRPVRVDGDAGTVEPLTP